MYWRQKNSCVTRGIRRQGIENILTPPREPRDPGLNPHQVTRSTQNMNTIHHRETDILEARAFLREETRQEGLKGHIQKSMIDTVITATIGIDRADMTIIHLEAARG